MLQLVTHLSVLINNNELAIRKKNEEFDESRKIHRDNSSNYARAKLDEQKNHGSFEVSGNISDFDIKSFLNSK